jgi:hypothetical protein
MGGSGKMKGKMSIPKKKEVKSIGSINTFYSSNEDFVLTVD